MEMYRDQSGEFVSGYYGLQVQIQCEPFAQQSRLVEKSTIEIATNQ